MLSRSDVKAGLGLGWFRLSRYLEEPHSWHEIREEMQGFSERSVLLALQQSPTMFERLPGPRWRIRHPQSERPMLDDPPRRRRGRPPLWARHLPEPPEPTPDVEDEYEADDDYAEEPARGSVQELIAVVEAFEARHPRPLEG